MGISRLTRREISIFIRNGKKLMSSQTLKDARQYEEKIGKAVPETDDG